MQGFGVIVHIGYGELRSKESILYGEGRCQHNLIGSGSLVAQVPTLSGNGKIPNGRGSLLGKSPKMSGAGKNHSHHEGQGKLYVIDGLFLGNFILDGVFTGPFMIDGELQGPMVINGSTAAN